MQYPKREIEFGNKLFMCFFFAIAMPSILLFFYLIYWTDIFETLQEKMTLNSLFFVKFPQSIRRFRDVPMTEELKAKITEHIKGTAYFKNWRFSQIKQLPKRVIEDPQEEPVNEDKDTDEETPNEEKQDKEDAEKEMDNSNANFVEMQQLSGLLTTTIPKKKQESDINHIERQ